MVIEVISYSSKKNTKCFIYILINQLEGSKTFKMLLNNITWL